MTETLDKYRYYLMPDYKSEWEEVEKSVWIKAERDAGFRPKLASSDPKYMTTCATGGFSGGGISGMIVWCGGD